MLLIVLAVALPAVSAQSPQLAGKNELGLHAWLDFQGPNGDNTDLLASYGWYLDDNLKLGAEYQWSLIEDIAPGEDDYRSQQGSFVAEWLFTGQSDWVPYVGGIVGFRNTKFEDLDESGMVYGGRLGLRYFISESVSVDTSVNMLMSGKKVFIVDFEADDQYVYPAVGLKAVF
jgi:hypothetical protein